jgi:hypothetical protein
LSLPAYQQHRGAVGAGAGEDVAEVGVGGDQDSVIVPGRGQDVAVGVGSQSDVTDVDGVVPTLSEASPISGDRFSSSRNLTLGDAAGVRALGRPARRTATTR